MDENLDLSALPKDRSAETRGFGVNLDLDFNNIINDLTVLSKTLDKNQVEPVKKIIKNVKILKKQVIKITTPKKPHNAVNSGFTRPFLISDEMAQFLNLPLGSRISRVQCIKLIHTFIINNNLQDPNDKRYILPNDELIKLLKHDENQPLCYQVIQKLIQVHFKK